MQVAMEKGGVLVSEGVKIPAKLIMDTICELKARLH